MSDAPGAPQRMSRAARRFLVVIPAYNEAATIEELIRRASRYLDVCVVDDCSNDGTADLVDATGPDIVEEVLQRRAFQTAAGQPAIVVSVWQHHPALVLLAGDVGGAGLPLSVERVELLLQTIL